MKRYIDVPSDWDEIDGDDWREALLVRDYATSHPRRAWTADDVRRETVRRWLSRRGMTIDRRDEERLQLVDALARTLGWLWPDDEQGLLLVFRTTRQLMPTMGGWHGPRSHGEDLCFGEFRQAMLHLRAWERDRNETALCALAGLLWRPADGDRRVAYDADGLDAQIRRGQQMTHWQRWAAYAWLAYFAEYLATGTFVIDGEEVTFEPLFGRKEPGGEAPGTGAGGGGLLRVALTLAEGGTFGTLSQTEHAPLLTVMLKLLMDYQTMQRMKKVEK